MKAFLLAILLFGLSRGARSQEAFIMGKTYPVGWVVYYPANVFWITKAAFNAKSYPAENRYWTRYYYPTTTPQTVTKSAFDSLLNRFDSIAARIKTIETKQQNPSAPNFTSKIKISQQGASLLYVKNDSELILRSFIPGDDYTWGLTDSTIKPIKKY
jgi:hypothetical protein